MNPFRKDFPILKRTVHNRPLVYLDNAATSQKPQSVIDAITDFYLSYNANIHRGLHDLSVEATDACHEARESVRRLIGADDLSEVIFTYGTTESINHVAYAWAERTLKSGDEILLSMMEHHANTVPWLELRKRKRIKLSFVPLADRFELDYDAMAKMVSKKTKLISLVHISNVLGVKNDVARIVSIAHRVGARVLIDAAQSVAREPIKVSRMGIDFMAFSGHKMYGPTGIGILYINKKTLPSMPRFLTGGGMILEVTHKKVTYQDPPEGFEAGTPHIAGIIGLGAAARYIIHHGIARMGKMEREVSRYGYDQLSKIPGITIYGSRSTRGILTFTLEGVHPHDIAEIVNRRGVAIRSGNHCVMPLHRHLGVVATARASIACYNTKAEIDVLMNALEDVRRIFH